MTDADRIAEMFGSLTETSPGVFTSPVGLTSDQLKGMAEQMVAEANLTKDELPAEIQNAPDEVRDRWQELRDKSPAVNLAEDLLNRERIQKVEDLVGGDPTMAEVLRMGPEQLAQLPPKNPDPDHPDRPQHPHFFALAEAVRSNDGYADRGVDLEEIFGLAEFDYESVLYMAQQRVLRWVHQAKQSGTEDAAEGAAQLAALWIDAFLAGLKVGDGRSTPLPGEVDITLAKVEDGHHRGRQL